MAAFRDILAADLYSYVNSVEKLKWLVKMAVAHIHKWEGTAGLRGLYCTRYKPRDGKPTRSNIPGFTSEDLRARYLIREQYENERRFSAYKAEAQKQLPGERVTGGGLAEFGRCWSLGDTPDFFISGFAGEAWS